MPRSGTADPAEMLDTRLRAAIAAVDLTPRPEHDALRDVIRDYVDGVVPMDDRDADSIRAGWRVIAAKLSAPALSIAEAHGGEGHTFAETALVVEEFGRRLAHPEILSSAVFATQLLCLVGDDAASARWLPQLANGSVLATVACDSAVTATSAAVVEARRRGSDWEISGEQSFVLDGDVAGLVLVVADTGSGTALFACEPPHPALRVEPLSTLDLTRGIARMRWDGVPAVAIGDVDALAPALSSAVAHTTIALATEQLGGADACLRMAVEYARIREQFGKPIGSFQAIKHTCADLLVALEGARSLVRFAVAAAVAGSDEIEAAASMAKAVCSDAYATAAAETIQILGGIGFTWEHPAHRYFRRARSTASLFGDAAHHRRVVADLLGVTS